MYIHYGAEAFDLKQFQNVSNVTFFSKPRGGLWASAVDAKTGWKTWCEDTNYEPRRGFDKHFCFVLTENARVCHIRKADDIYKLPSARCLRAGSTVYIDFEEASKNWDAIEVHISEDPATDYTKALYWLLYGWDCDSILIMNPNVVREVNR